MKASLSLVVLLAPFWAMAQATPMTLQQAITFAKANSPVLQGARAELQGSIASAKGAHAMTGPQISANGFATTGSESSILSSVPNTDPFDFMQVPSGPFGDANLMLMVPILADDMWAMASSAKWQSIAASADFQEAEADLEFNVSQAYYEVKSKHEEVLADQAAFDALAELNRTTQARFQAGKTIEASVDQVQARQSRAQRDLTSAKNSEANALLDFLAIIGDKLDAQVSLSDAKPPEINPLNLNDLIKTALANRGELVASRAREKASESGLKAANALGQPRLYAVGMADAASRSGMGGLTLGLTLSFPIYDGGRIQSQIDKSKAVIAQANADVAATKIQVEKQVRQALLDYETAVANLTSAQSELTAANSAYDVIALRVEAGKSILLEQLEGLDQLTRARSDLAQARLDLNIADASLLRATGGHLEP